MSKTCIGILASSVCLFGQVVYVANSGSNNISAYAVDASSGALTAVPGSPFAAGMSPSGIAVDPAGKFVYVANLPSDNISAYSIDGATGALNAIAGSPFPVGTERRPAGLAVDPTGKFLYVANCSDFSCQSDFRFSYPGSISAFAINASSGALTAVPGSPFSVTESGYGRPSLAVGAKFVYMVVAFNSPFGTATPSNIYAFTINAASGVLTAVPGPAFLAGSQSLAAALDPAGKFLYVPNASSCVSCPPANVSAFAVNVGTGALTAVPGSPFPTGFEPSGIAVDPTGKYVYVSNSVSSNISAYTINASSGALAAVPGSPFAAGMQPKGVAVDSTGKLFYATSSFSNTVWAYTINAASGALTPAPGLPVAAGTGPFAIAIRSVPLPPAPAIAALTPSSATAGGAAFTLTVTGTGFLSGATVQWNGSPLATTFVSATQLTAAVPASLIATAGSANITVAGSKAVSFTINPAGIPITVSGVVNAASKAGGGVAPGEIVIISGSGFGPGVRALFDGTPAPILDMQAGQMTAVVPYAVTGHASTQLQVSLQGQSSNSVNLQVVDTAPGIFSIVNEDGSANAPGAPAAVGSVVVLSATGEGQTDPPGVDGKLGDSPAPVPLQPVSVTIGGLDAQVVSAGGAPGLVAGYLQVAVQIPDGVDTGDAVPIVLKIGERTSQANVTLAVQ